MAVHEPESYVCQASGLVCEAHSSNVPLTEAEAEAAALEAAKDLKQDARSMCLDTARRGSKRLAPGDRLDAKELAQQTNARFDGLQMDSVDEVLRVWPGKELLKRERHHLKATTGRTLNRAASWRLSRIQTWRP